MIVDCISDLHGHFPELEGGDLLIVAGDLTARDTLFEHADFTKWLAHQKYRMKIVIAGNHDGIIEKEIKDGIQGRHARYDNYYGNAIYLEDSGTEFEGLKIWGSPWTKTFEGMNPHCKAFTVDTEEELAEKWKLIPNDVDILITHSPQWGMLDRCTNGYLAGSPGLTKYCAKHVSTLKLMVCGHIHESYGHYDVREIQKRFDDSTIPIYVNACHVNEHYQPVNKPIRVIL